MSRICFLSENETMFHLIMIEAEAVLLITVRIYIYICIFCKGERHSISIQQTQMRLENGVTYTQTNHFLRYMRILSLITMTFLGSQFVNSIYNNEQWNSSLIKARTHTTTHTHTHTPLPTHTYTTKPTRCIHAFFVCETGGARFSMEKISQKN